MKSNWFAHCLVLTAAAAMLAGCGGSSSSAPAQSSDNSAAGSSTESDNSGDSSATANDTAGEMKGPAATTHSSGKSKPATEHSTAPAASSSGSESGGETPKEEKPSEEPPKPVIPKGYALVPAGTVIEAVLTTAVSTKTSSVGQEVRAQVAHGIVVDDDKRVPAKGWRLIGSIAAIKGPEAKGDVPAEVEFSFNALRDNTKDSTKEFEISAVLSEVGGDAKKRNIGVIAGSALAGALLGNKMGKNALLSAAAGAAAGAGIVRALPGKHVELEQGAAIKVTLDRDAILPVEDRPAK